MHKRIARNAADLCFSAIHAMIGLMHEVLFEEPGPTPGRLLAGHFLEQYGYHVRRACGTRDWLLTLTISGEGCYRLGGRTHICRQGSIVLLPPGNTARLLHAEWQKSWGFFWVHFTPRSDWIDWLKWSRSNEFNELTLTDDDAEYSRVH